MLSLNIEILPINIGILSVSVVILPTGIGILSISINRDISNKKEFEDTKGVIKIRKSKDKPHNDQKKKDKRTNDDLQNIHITRTSQKAR